MKNLIRPLLFLAAISPAIALAHIPLTLPNGQAMPSLAPMLADVTPAVVNITVLKPASDQDSDDSNSSNSSSDNRCSNSSNISSNNRIKTPDVY